MKATLISLVAVSLTAGIARAEVPKKPPLKTYTKLWSESPICSKPPQAKPEHEDSAMADWTLGGVSEIEGGNRVTLLHKKNAGESMVIRPGSVQKRTPDKIESDITPGDSGTFKLDRVEYGKGGWKDISVHLSDGTRSGVVRFDEKNLIPKASAPVAGKHPGQPGPPNPQAPAPSGTRPRVAQPVKR